MRFFIKDQTDKCVGISIRQSGESGVLITGTTSNYLDQGIFVLKNGLIKRFVLPHDFIEESGILTDNYNKIVID